MEVISLKTVRLLGKMAQESVLSLHSRGLARIPMCIRFLSQDSSSGCENSFSQELVCRSILPVFPKFLIDQAESPALFQPRGFTFTGDLCGCRPNGLTAYSLIASFSYRSTRAPPPPASFLTSAREAIEVSPGVVIASAPWAAPRFTASCGSPLVRNP